MLELVSGALSYLWVLCVFLSGAPDTLARWTHTRRARLTSPPPRGLEWRSVRRLPAGRIVAVRFQVILA